MAIAFLCEVSALVVGGSYNGGWFDTCSMSKCNYADYTATFLMFCKLGKLCGSPI